MIKKLKTGSVQLHPKIWEYLDNEALEDCVSTASVIRKYIVAGLIANGVTKEEIRHMMRDEK